MADGINLRLGRRDMNVFRTIDRGGERPVVHVAGRHPAALCPSCAHPSVDTNGTGWRDVIDVVRTLVITLSTAAGTIKMLLGLRQHEPDGAVTNI